MATKRIAQSAINWTALAERVPANQRINFLAFKVKHDGYLRSVLSNPEVPPKLDWTTYKGKVPVAGMVEEFQKQYEALKVPFPADTMTSAVEAQEKEVQKEIAQFKAESNSRIAELEAEIAKLNALLPYDQMTMEDFRDAHPDQALDPINRPTFWPHLPEDQVGYKPKDAIAAEHH